MNTATAAAARAEIGDVARDLAALEPLSVAQLAARYAELLGREPRSRNKRYLRKRVAFRIQELAEGGLSPRAKARIEEIAPEAPTRFRRGPLPKGEQPATPAPIAIAAAPSKRDPRLPPPGSTLKRRHGDVDHTVTVLDDGFEYAGQRYASLSAIARVITGTPWNGFTFFALGGAKAKGGGR